MENPSCEIQTQMNKSFRTVVCKYYKRGYCVHGDKCKFAHKDLYFNSLPDIFKVFFHKKLLNGDVLDGHIQTVCI